MGTGSEPSDLNALEIHGFPFGMVTAPRPGGGMDDWWSELDDDVLRTLAERSAATPAEVGERLGISEASAASLLAMLAVQGKVRIRLVEGTDLDLWRPTAFQSAASR
ncbi:MAG: hypothetical protein AUH81_20225 [Candidatus Rokubacteria bacterium 13_1_40CM_4_69_5]|nr:MAG: hypothetical protein AUH81_20225 [Candidatus Rokubacteria bacterium 13_1_40CM_4_69_5]